MKAPISAASLLVALGLASAAGAGDTAQNRLRKSLAQAPRAAQRLDLKFQNADLKEVLRFLAEAGGVSVVVPEHVAGRVTVHLTNVRWVDALSAVLASQGLDARLEGSILVVDTLERWTAREEQQVERRKAQEALAPLVTKVIPVSYARARDLVPLIEPLLSARGQVSADDRTNTLIVTDVAERVQRAVRTTGGG